MAPNWKEWPCECCKSSKAWGMDFCEDCGFPTTTKNPHEAMLFEIEELRKEVITIQKRKRRARAGKI